MNKTPINNGGPAFPSQENVNDPRTSGLLFTQGMTLRDWFAGMALQGIAAAQSGESFSVAMNDEIKRRKTSAPEMVALMAYNAADAMLAARAQTKNQEP